MNNYESFTYKVYLDIKNDFFLSGAFECPFYLGGRFFLLGNANEVENNDQPLIHPKIVRFILNDKLDTAVHWSYKSNSKEKWYHRVEENFYLEVEEILAQRQCQQVAPEVCMALQAIAFNFKPWFNSHYEHLRDVDKSKLRPERRKKVESYYLGSMEEREFHMLMQKTIALKNENRLTGTFDCIIIKDELVTINVFKHGWLKEQLLTLYEKGAFPAVALSGVRAPEPDLRKFSNIEVNRDYKYNPAHRMFNMLVFLMNHNEVAKPNTEALKIIGELYALIGIFSRPKTEKIEFVYDNKKYNFQKKEKLKSKWDEELERKKIIKKETSRLHEKDRRKLISKWVLLNIHGRRESTLDDAPSEIIESLLSYLFEQ